MARLGKFNSYSRSVALGERFQSSNHMGCSKRPHPWDGKSKMQLWGFARVNFGR